MRQYFPPFLALFLAAAAFGNTCQRDYGQLPLQPTPPRLTMLLTEKQIPLEEAERIIAGDAALAAKYEIKDTKELKLLLRRVIPETERDLRAIESFLAPVVHLPEHTQFQMSLREAAPSANFQKNLVKAAHQYVTKDPRTQKLVAKHPKFTRPVNLHEYAHMILEENLRRKFPGFNELRERAKNSRFEKMLEMSGEISEENDRLLELYSRISDAKKRLKAGPPDGIRKMMLDELQALQREQQHLTRKIAPQLEKILLAGSTDFFMPYHELFSDLAPVLLTNNKNLIYKSLHFARMEKERIAARSFDSLALKEAGVVASPSPHAFLAKVRQHIGETLMPEARTQEERRRLLKAVYRTIEEEIEEAVRTGNFVKTQAETVESMIRRINQHWKKSPTDL